MRVLLTGATGFVGKHVISALQKKGISIRVLLRSNTHKDQFDDACLLKTLKSDSDWQALFTGVDAVVHLAGRAHVTDKKYEQDDAFFYPDNVQLTEILATRAASYGVKRFIFLSSLHVHGKISDVALTEDSPFNPQNAYARSKVEAERLLREKSGAMEWVILRPPLIYGEGVKANFKALTELVAKGIPLPFASITNRRSLLSVARLADYVTICLAHKAATNQVFLVADQHDYTTPDIIRLIATQLCREVKLFAFPVELLKWVLTLLRRKWLYQSLCGSLFANTQKIQRL